MRRADAPVMVAGASRQERDSLGVRDVPADALYGIFTARARDAFQLSRRTVHPAVVRAYAQVKKAAARANARLDLLPRRSASAIVHAADQIIAGRVPDAAVLDPFQAGAGTPMHMNVNEVIANLANERLGGRRGTYRPIHPNNDVNLGQSSNDVTPTVIRLMALDLSRAVDTEVRGLASSFRALARRERDVVKPGRTHLQDAVPVTWGQVFDSYAESMVSAADALVKTRDELRVIGLGGTAAGTGLTAHPRFAALVTRELSRQLGETLRLAPSRLTTTWSLRPLLACSAALRGIAVDLGKICVDLRLLASGPHTGLAEISLPEVEPGSSIMPGKVNPSVPEAVQMVTFQVCANDHAIALAAGAGELELNVMTPLVATNLSESLELLARAVALLRTRAVDGLVVDRERARALVSGSLIEATTLSPYLGYDVVAYLVKEALGSARPLRDVVAGHALLDAPTLARLLRPEMSTRPTVIDTALRGRVQSSRAYRTLKATMQRGARGTRA